jgi:polyferredoxin
MVVRLLFSFLAVCIAVPALAADPATRYPPLRGFFPEATRFSDFQGSPPAVTAWRGHEPIGRAMLSGDVAPIPAYSGYPINTLVGLDREGRIAGVAIIHHDEPILAAGVSEAQLRGFVEQYLGKSARDRFSVGADRPGYVRIDGISGATITAMVESATIEKTARSLAATLPPVAAHPVTGAPQVERTAAVRIPAKPVTAERARNVPPVAEPNEPAGALPDATPAGDEPVWAAVWHERRMRVGVLIAGLAALTVVLFFQDWFVRRPALFARVRMGFLLFTLFFLGWYGLAQLSVVNVLTFTHAAMRDFRWQDFLMDPLLFVLWTFVAVTLLLWGRGVYCGWLCPFGALQELSFRLARWLRLPHFEIPAMVHERLWAVKYIVLVVLFGLSLQSLTQAQLAAEVEPFKTVFTLHFDREWYFGLYAAALVAVGLFNRKFFCKYLCALGAALTFPARFRIFDWLHRHRECGRPCQICAAECEVQAIKKNGEINANECHYCLDCQLSYWNDRKCPPMVERRKRRERSALAAQVVEAVNAVGLAAGTGVCAVDPDTCRTCPSRCDRA